MTVDREKIKAMLREDKERRNKYFRTYDPIRGDSLGEVVPRSPFVIYGKEYFVPNEITP